MAIYKDTKIRYDGSNWIGLYSKKSEFSRGPVRPGEIVNVVVPEEDSDIKRFCETASERNSSSLLNSGKVPLLRSTGVLDSSVKDKKDSKFCSYSITKKGFFNSLYNSMRGIEKEKRDENILKIMTPLFKDNDEAELFVNKNVDRMKRNLVIRRMRFVRKCKMTYFNYFVTFTYDDNKMNEEQFRKKLLNCIRHLANRSGWKYAGVWERGGKTQRLHFHALFYIPDGTFRGELVERETYSFKQHKRIKVLENSYFRKRFGMNEFEPIDDQSYKYCVNYIMKYLEKSGEKISYSRKLPMYYVCDTSSEDVIVPFNVDYPNKVILSRNFIVYKDGKALGEISEEIIKTLPQANN